MNDQTTELLSGLKDRSVSFKEVIEFIEARFEHTPTAFKNGEVYNESSQNQGSAKVFTFAKINNLTEADTLYLFAEHYQSVLEHPEATDHQNIRQFMIHGWEGVAFDDQALMDK